MATPPQAPLLVCVVATYTAQQALAPSLGPLTRSLGLPELAVGAVVALAAATFAASSLAWAAVVPRWGHRRVLLVGAVTGAFALVLFAVGVHLSITGALSAEQGLMWMLVARGLGFGAAIGAVPVAVLSMVALQIPAGPGRVSAVGRVAAAQSSGGVLGPAVGGLLATTGLMGPVWAAPALMAVAVLAVLAPKGERSPAPPSTPRPSPHPVVGAHRSPRGALRAWGRRLRRWLVSGLLVTTASGMVVVVVPFLVQDRLGADAATSTALTGLVYLGSGLALIAVQIVLLPRLGWTAERLLLAGALAALVGLACLVAASSPGTVIGSMALFSAGTGLATPGFTAGASHVVDDDAQPAVAGLLSACAGVSFVIGPLVGTCLYPVDPMVPLAAAAVLCAGVPVVLRGRGDG